jgi:hypothetical protein
MNFQPKEPMRQTIIRPSDGRVPRTTQRPLTSPSRIDDFSFHDADADHRATFWTRVVVAIVAACIVAMVIA